MTILEIFEKVNLAIPIEQRDFFNYYEDSVNELCALYNGFVFDGEYSKIDTLNDDNVVKPLYCNAIVDNIIFLAGGSETYKAEFLRKANAAYLKYWNDNAKGRRMKRMRW